MRILQILYGVLFTGHTDKVKAGMSRKTIFIHGLFPFFLKSFAKLVIG